MNPTRTRSLLVAVCLGLFYPMATTAQAGDTTEQPIKQLNEASDLIHWPDGFSPKQTDAFRRRLVVSLVFSWMVVSSAGSVR
jgi:hypothetical protein